MARISVITNGCSTKYPMIATQEYIIWAEPFRGRIWIHVDIFKWSPTIKRQYLNDFARLKGTLYAVNTAKDKHKLAKFILLHPDWHLYEKRDFGSGITYDVYRRL